MFRDLLCLLCLLTGTFMVVGGFYLIWAQKIYIDKETSQVVDIELPIFGKFRTNIPALVLFVLGFLPVFYAVHEYKVPQGYEKVEDSEIRGTIKGGVYPVIVYAARAEQALNSAGDAVIDVPFLPDRPGDRYRVLVVVNGQVIQDVAADRLPKQQQIKLTLQPMVLNQSSYQQSLAPVPEDFR